MIRAAFSDLTALWHIAARKMFLAGPIGSDGILDWKGSSETYSYSNVLRANSMAFEFDVGRDLSLNRSRFTTLQRAYLHPTDLDAFMARVENIGKKTAARGVLTTMTVRQKEGSKGRYANGPCIIGYGWRGGHRGPPPTLTLHSRTSYLTYMGGMDLALCHVLASNIADVLGIEVEDIKFEWFSDALMTHNYKQIPYAMVHIEDLIKKRKTYPSDQHPSLKLLRREWDIMLNKIDTPLADEKWGARRRVWRRYRELQAGGGPPDCPVQSLTLEKLYDFKKRKPDEPDDIEYDDDEEDE
jgi:hypothetical protein